MTIDQITSFYNEKILDFDYKNLVLDDLFRGKLGVINYLLAFYDKTNDSKYLDKISDILEIILSNIEESNETSILNNSTLMYGTSGLCFTLQELINRDLIDAIYFENQINDLDTVILQNSISQINQEYFDFLGGPIGNLTYFLKSNRDKKLSDEIIQNLLNVQTKTGKLFYTKSNSVYTHGFNLGIKHGQLGILKSLLDYHEKYEINLNHPVTELLRDLINNFVKELEMDYTINDIHIYKYYSIHENNGSIEKHQNNRLCWCNSDLTLAYYLIKTGMLLENENLLNLSYTIGKETTKRQIFETTGVESHYFCHGSSGLVFVYDKMFEITSNDMYFEASKFWHNVTKEYLENEIKNDFTTADLPWLRGGKLGSLLVLNKMYDNKMFQFLL